MSRFREEAHEGPTSACDFLSGNIASTALADAIDNPVYKTWANCGIGTTITLSSSGDGGITLIERLVSVADDKCVVHTEIVSTKHTFPTRDEDVPRQLTDPDAIEKLKKELAHPVDDTITTPAGEFKCKRYEYPLEDVGTAKLWMSDDVPSGLVKMESTITELHRTTTQQIIKIEKK